MCAPSRPDRGFETVPQCPQGQRESVLRYLRRRTLRSSRRWAQRSEVQVRAVARGYAHSFGPLAFPQRQFGRPFVRKQLRKRESWGHRVQVPQQLADCNAWVTAFKPPSCAARDARTSRRVALPHLMRSAQRAAELVERRGPELARAALPERVWRPSGEAKRSGRARRPEGGVHMMTRPRSPKP